MFKSVYEGGIHYTDLTPPPHTHTEMHMHTLVAIVTKVRDSLPEPVCLVLGEEIKKEERC